MELKKDFWVDSSFKVKAMDGDTNSIMITGYASTVSKDRAGDVVLASAWEKDSALGNYFKNPIVLFGHDHRQPIGKMVDYQLDEYGLSVDIEVFDVDPRVYKLVKGGALTTFSIGFRLKDYKFDEGSETFLITELELFEISIVSVPCNQDCTFELSKSMRDDGSYEELRNEAIAEIDKNKGLTKPTPTKELPPTFNSELEKLAYYLSKQ
jgi:HK97 family phage prohead protease